MLSQYVGWGGMASAFSPDNRRYEQLRSLLTEDEYKAARASVLNAHYTSPTIIRAIYDAAAQFGFENGKILEPSMGVGNFFGMLPERMKDSQLTGVELDSISGRIARKLYPNADIKITGYENTKFADNSFDCAVGNVPFGDYSLHDKRYDKEHLLIHDYFFVKSLDKVRPGGLCHLKGYARQGKPCRTPLNGRACRPARCNSSAQYGIQGKCRCQRYHRHSVLAKA